MKIKYANNPNPKNILENKFKSIEVKDEYFEGYISLVCVTKAKKGYSVPRYGGREQKIFDNNHKWVMLHPKNKNYMVTAMYDENLNFIEFYIDMIEKVGVTQEGIPYMHDLFLDVVITCDREVYVLDQEELYEALKNKDITAKQYQKANVTSKNVISYYSKKENFDKLKAYTDKYLQVLLKEIKDDFLQS